MRFKSIDLSRFTYQLKGGQMIMEIMKDMNTLKNQKDIENREKSYLIGGGIGFH